jgi:hypothetical protein
VAAAAAQAARYHLLAPILVPAGVMAGLLFVIFLVVAVPVATLAMAGMLDMDIAHSLQAGLVAAVLVAGPALLITHLAAVLVA